ncbi:MAG: hypothetical protein JXB05_01040 [Myxococcaceae bacterium]|nr:hypothetical protein [Myxococcaceae bacterium]
MATDFAELLYRYLPGLYRDKDTLGELQRFLQIIALPLEELEASVGQLYEDFFISGCRPELIPLLGALVGVEVDTTLPLRAQRTQVSEAVRFYRSKGTQQPLERWAESLTQWRVTLVDFSKSVAQVPFLEAMNPVSRLRDQLVAELPPGSGNCFFSAEQRLQPLFDAITGRFITRKALAGNEAKYAGVEGRFTIEERGVDLFKPPAGTPYVAVAADLTDFSTPLDAGGAPLAIAAHQIAVDPVLGRFKIVSPLPSAGNLRVTFHALTPAIVTTQAFHVGDPSRMRQLGRSDDPAPYTLDIRAPRSVTDRTGQKHFDNHGFFVTPCRVLANQRPNLIPAGSSSGRFTFDGSPLTLGDTEGISLQLLDGIDGTPLTRRKVAGQVQRYAGQPCGFTIRIRGVSLTDPAFQPSANLVIAHLENFNQPKGLNGILLELSPTDVVVDPQLGRILMNLSALGATAEDVRVDYLLGALIRVEDAAPLALTPITTGGFAFSKDGARVRLRDALDGTPVDESMRLGRLLSLYHGTSRGWSILRNGAPVAPALPAELRDLSDMGTPVLPGRIFIDPWQGRFKFPAGFLAPGDQITVSYASSDAAAEARIFASLAQRLPSALPAGVAPVIVDTRSIPVQPARLH